MWGKEVHPKGKAGNEREAVLSLSIYLAGALTSWTTG